MYHQATICCPNCGSLAKRIFSDCLPNSQGTPGQPIIQTECPVCDYFMVMGWQDGKVLEAHAPGLWNTVGLSR